MARPIAPPLTRGGVETELVAQLNLGQARFISRNEPLNAAGSLDEGGNDVGGAKHYFLKMTPVENHCTSVAASWSAALTDSIDWSG